MPNVVEEREVELPEGVRVRVIGHGSKQSVVFVANGDSPEDVEEKLLDTESAVASALLA